jgi:hypothetical protein
MKTFEIEISLEHNICIELCCLNCKSEFSTELDSTNDLENFPHSSSSVLYCQNCEIPYEYDIVFDSNRFQIKFQNDDLIGELKYSDNIDWDEYKIHSTFKSKQFYNIQIQRLKKILELKSNEYIIDQSLNKLVFTGVVTAFETYLSEVFYLIVFYSDSTLEKFVSEYEPYKKEKISLHEIITKFNSLNNRVQEDLDNIIYHNISKLINIFNIFNFELDKFDKIQNMSRHIQKRHNFVHRSGLEKNETFEEITKENVEILISDANSFVNYINNKIEKKCFLPDYDYDEDYPF